MRDADPRKMKNTERRLEWVPVAKMRLSERAQRQHSSSSAKAKIARIASEFDPDLFGYPCVSFRDGFYWIIDGGHRYLAIIDLGYEDQYVQCWVYRGINEKVEADKFLRHNDVKAVGSMDKFRVALVAGYAIETDIDRVVRAADMKIGQGRECIGCIAAVRKVYARSGPKGLALTVRVIRDAYGESGFVAHVTDGIGLFAQNYEGKFNESRLITALSKKKGGINGLISEAEHVRKRYSVNQAQSVAASVVEIYNKGLTGKQRLNGWWSTFNFNGSESE